MSKINKIRLSGTDYDIQDVSATSVVEVTQQQYDDLPASAKTDNILYIITDSTVDYVTSAQTQSAITQAVSGKVDTSTYTTYTAATATALNGKQDTLVSSSNIKTINNESLLGSGNIDIQCGNSVVELTQAAYDALVTGGTVDPDTFYIITDATPADMSQYWTSAQTQSAITQAVSGKQDTLVSGTNIKTINNTSLLGSGNIDIQGGGGKAIEAGRGISITTGATADTVSLNLSISAGTGNNSIVEGDNTTASGNYSHAEGFRAKANGLSSHAEGAVTNANGDYSHAEGDSTTASGKYSHAEGAVTNASGKYSHTEGCNTTANNQSEHASGQYNNSVSATTTFGDSGNTLFSVGNGTADNARHNAFEIRQNGDIYLSSGGTDIKLQDHLGGGGSSYTAGDGIDITNNVISVTGKVDTSTYETYTAATDTAIAGKQDILTGGGGIDIHNDVISVTGKADTSAVTAIQDSLSGYVTTDTEQHISGRKVFTYTSSGAKAIEFKQTDDSSKVGFTVRNSAATNNELASFELRPNTFTVDGVQHPLLYFGHYRSTNIANAGVPQTYIGFRQYDQLNAAAYHYLIPLPEKAKTPFSLTTSFKDYYAPMGFKNGSTMITADNTGVVDLSSELGGLKLVKLTQAEYDALSPNYDSNTLYVING